MSPHDEDAPCAEELTASATCKDYLHVRKMRSQGNYRGILGSSKERKKFVHKRTPAPRSIRPPVGAPLVGAHTHHSASSIARIDIRTLERGENT